MNSKKENYKTFVPITPNNSASSIKGTQEVDNNTATAIPFIYSFSGNSAATFMCL